MPPNTKLIQTCLKIPKKTNLGQRDPHVLCTELKKHQRMLENTKKSWIEMKNKEFLANTKSFDNMAAYGANNKIKKGCKWEDEGAFYTYWRPPSPLKLPTSTPT